MMTMPPFTERPDRRRYRHAWPGFLLLGALMVLLASLLAWGDHFLTPGPAGGMRRLLQLGTDASPQSSAEPDVADSGVPSGSATAGDRPRYPASDVPEGVPSDGAAPGGVTTPAAPRPGSSPPASPRVRYALDLGTFALDEDAERTEAQLNGAGFSTVRFRQQAPARLFTVTVRRAADPGLLGGAAATVQPRPESPAAAAGAPVKVAQALPLRSAVELAGRLRAAGFDVQITSEAATRGQLALRHGAFVSWSEARLASQRVFEMGVPNEVVRVDVR